jgi:hypothetical protein
MISPCEAVGQWRQAMRKRGRELGLPFAGTPGLHNAITDVAGI